MEYAAIYGYINMLMILDFLRLQDFEMFLQICWGSLSDFRQCTYMQNVHTVANYVLLSCLCLAYTYI